MINKCELNEVDETIQLEIMRNIIVKYTQHSRADKRIKLSNTFKQNIMPRLVDHESMNMFICTHTSPETGRMYNSRWKCDRKWIWGETGLDWAKIIAAQLQALLIFISDLFSSLESSKYSTVNDHLSWLMQF